jgi:hypothetical protein
LSGRHEDSCGKSKSRETPQERSDEEAPGLPAESEVSGAQINRPVLHSKNARKEKGERLTFFSYVIIVTVMYWYDRYSESK